MGKGNEVVGAAVPHGRNTSNRAAGASFLPSHLCPPPTPSPSLPLSWQDFAAALPALFHLAWHCTASMTELPAATNTCNRCRTDIERHMLQPSKVLALRANQQAGAVFAAARTDHLAMIARARIVRTSWSLARPNNAGPAGTCLTVQCLVDKANVVQCLADKANVLLLDAKERCCALILWPLAPSSAHDYRPALRKLKAATCALPHM